jgi:hypothetical protein
MSALGQKRTYAAQQAMSALPPIARESAHLAMQESIKADAIES